MKQKNKIIQSYAEKLIKICENLDNLRHLRANESTNKQINK